MYHNIKNKIKGETKSNKVPGSVNKGNRSIIFVKNILTLVIIFPFFKQTDHI